MDRERQYGIDRSGLVPRVRLAMDTIDEIVPAYIVRSGLALHQRATGAGPRWVLTASGLGRRVAAFEKLDQAEAAFVVLAPLCDWEDPATWPADLKAKVGEALQPIIARAAATPPETGRPWTPALPGPPAST